MFALACLNYRIWIICLVGSALAIDEIAPTTFRRSTLVQRQEVPTHETPKRGACSREKVTSYRSFARLLFALRPTNPLRFPYPGMASRLRSSELKSTVQNAETLALQVDSCRRFGGSKRFGGTATMLAIDVSTPWTAAIAAASVHGLTDFRWRPKELIPYLLMFAPIPTELVTVLFILASIQHFSHDIGLKPSLLLHMTFAGLAPVLPQLAWSIFALYYCGCHAPLHLVNHVVDIDGRLVVLLLMSATIALVGMHDVETFELTDTMQLGVVAHIVVDEIQRGSKLSGESKFSTNSI